MPTPHLFPVNQAIESIFSPKNIDKDCRSISSLMPPVENAIELYLFDGMYADAVEMFLRLVDSMCYHFVADEHWNYFDAFIILSMMPIGVGSRFVAILISSRRRCSMNWRRG